MEEEWKNIKGYEGKYQISNIGNVKSLLWWSGLFKKFFNKERFLIKTEDNHGYYYVTLCKDNKKKKFLVHRLVAEAFIPNPENKPQVNHIDGNKKNNQINNLEWCTNQENISHALKTGLKNDYGCNSYLSKFSENDIDYIRNHYIPKDKEFGCRALARKFNVSKSTISYIINYRTYFK